MKRFSKGLSFMLMFALVGAFALRTASITASAGSANSDMLDWTQRNAPTAYADEVAAIPLVVAAAVVGGAVVGALVTEVLHHHFSYTETLANNSEVQQVFAEGDKLFDL